MNYMKIKFYFAFLIIFSSFLTAQNYSLKLNRNFKVQAENPLSISRNNEIIQLKISAVKEKYPSFNENAFIVKSGTKEVPSQLEDIDADDKNDNILFLASFSPKEKKVFTVEYSAQGSIKKSYEKRTQAQLGVKKDYKLENGIYSGGKFVNEDSVSVPANHFAHDALYRAEGPVWESDLIAYRFYLDSRNRTDIFGKKTNDLIVHKIGVNDLVSDSKESYTNMLDWGMDIFKVGETLGIGSIAAWMDDKPVTVSNVEKVVCRISVNGVIQSDVVTKYMNWKVNQNKYDLLSNLSISAESRLTKVNISLNKQLPLCTGIAKHENTNFIKSAGNNDWQYIALYGAQSLSGDSLGIAVFYKESDFNKVVEDSLNQIVVFKPAKKVKYYFAAAWQKEPDGIKNQDEFNAYLKNTSLKLSNPILVTF